MNRLKLFLLFFLATLGYTSVAESRAGGGQHYSGGSSRSSGGGGSSYHGGGYSGGGTHGSYSSSRTSFPSIVWVIAGVLVITLLIASSRKKTIRRAKIEGDRVLQDAGLAALQSEDPGFSLEAFLERGKLSLLKLNQAWVQGNMQPVRRLISDGVYVRFQTQLALMRAQGVKNVMADVSVLSAELLAAQADPHFDVLHLKLSAQARDLDVPVQMDADAAMKKAKGALLAPYEEVWSFLRKRGQKSKQGVPTMEGQCPNCGAELPVSDTVQCEHCKALVNSPEHDWVLAEITQPEEWEGALAVQELPWLALVQEKDPQVSRQALEDKASVLFWKWIEAKVTGSTKRLARFCAHGPEEAGFKEGLLLEEQRLWRVAVGSVDVREVSVGAGSGTDEVVVEVRWSAALGANAEAQGYRCALVMKRDSGAKSPQGLSSIDCPVCRGPLAESDAVTCPYCQSLLQGSKHDWALAAIRLIS